MQNRNLKCRSYSCVCYLGLNMLVPSHMRQAHIAYTNGEPMASEKTLHCVASSACRLFYSGSVRVDWWFPREQQMLQHILVCWGLPSNRRQS